MRGFAKVFVNFCRVVVAAVFLLSGLIKLNDPVGFSIKLQEYFAVFEANFGLGFTALVPYADSLANTFAVLEVALALLLILGLWRGMVSMLLIILIIFFTLLTGYSAVTNLVTDCGCFGEVIKLAPWQSFVKDVVLLVFIFIIFTYREYMGMLTKKWQVNLVGFLLAILLPIGLVWYTSNHLPLIDFRPYKVGAQMPQLLETLDADGLPLAKGYKPFAEACADSSLQSEFEAPTLLIISYDLKRADPADLEAAAQLAKDLAGSDVQVIGGTANASSVREKLAEEYGLAFCWTGQDRTMLQTMIRSNPGYVLLSGGEIRAKWHANDVPTAQQVEAKK